MEYYINEWKKEYNIWINEYINGAIDKCNHEIMDAWIDEIRYGFVMLFNWYASIHNQDLTNNELLVIRCSIYNGSKGLYEKLWTTKIFIFKTDLQLLKFHFV